MEPCIINKHNKFHTNEVFQIPKITSKVLLVIFKTRVLLEIVLMFDSESSGTSFFFYM